MRYRTLLVILIQSGFACALGLSQTLTYPPGSAIITPPTYQIRPNDEINVKYRYTPQYNGAAKVTPDGFVALSLVGSVHLAGMTVDEARTLIHDKASSAVIDPKIDIEITSFEKPYFVVAGQVTNPGHYDLITNPTSLLEALSQAGGFKNSSKTTRVMIYRKYKDGLTYDRTIDARRLMEEPQQEISYSIRPGDVIVVPQNKASSVERVLKTLNLGVYYPLP